MSQTKSPLHPIFQDIFDAHFPLLRQPEFATRVERVCSELEQFLRTRTPYEDPEAMRWYEALKTQMLLNVVNLLHDARENLK